MDKSKTRKHKLDFFETSLEVETKGGIQITDIFEKDLTLNCAFVVLQSISTNLNPISLELLKSGILVKASFKNSNYLFESY